MLPLFNAGKAVFFGRIALVRWEPSNSWDEILSHMTWGWYPIHLWDGSLEKIFRSKNWKIGSSLVFQGICKSCSQWAAWVTKNVMSNSENKAPSVSTYQGFYRLGWGMKATFAGNSNAALAYLYQITNNILLAKLLQGRSCIRINYKHLPGMKRSLPSWDWSNYSERKWG